MNTDRSVRVLFAELLATRKVGASHALLAVVGQVIGSVAGGAVIYTLATGPMRDSRGSFASNLWTGEYHGFSAMVVAEIVLTALLVVVVLAIGSKGFPGYLGGIVAGLTLTLIHLISIPVDNTSVNPARSLGMAVFADRSSDALQQLWAFVLFPLAGAVVGVGVWLLLGNRHANTDS